jgi:7-cyano-7-deazaguanine synthase in queuosine biosynthesis
MEAEKEEVHLLWTGGWESTYRLCDLIFVKKQNVCPIYILDTERKSFREEIKAMVAIREEIIKRISDNSQLLKPIQIVVKDDIPKNKIIMEMHESIVAQYGRLGMQYEWLARYVQWKGLNRIEIGVEGNSSSPRKAIFAKLEKALVVEGDSLVLGNEFDEPLLELFRFFSFPLFNLAKHKIYLLARDQPFYDLMLKTWFCHNPRNGKPCGICRPCQQVMSENLGFRVPFSGKMRYALKKYF